MKSKVDQTGSDLLKISTFGGVAFASSWKEASFPLPLLPNCQTGTRVHLFTLQRLRKPELGEMQ